MAGEPGGNLGFPLISDPMGQAAEVLGLLMLDKKKPINDSSGFSCAKGLFFIDGKKNLRCAIYYPQETGVSFKEVVRVLTSLNLTENYMLYTPANWQEGDDVIIGPDESLPLARKRFGDVKVVDLPSKKEYLRFVRYPSVGIRNDTHCSCYRCCSLI